MKIRCISIRQPWASMIVYGSKWAEIRSQRSGYRGELWIHASERWSDEWERPADPEAAFGIPCPTGAVIGRVTMLGCWSVREIADCRGGVMPDDERLWEALRTLALEPKNFFGWDYIPEPERGDDPAFGHLLADRQALVEPIAAKGRLGLWTTDVPDALLDLAARSDSR